MKRQVGPINSVMVGVVVHQMRAGGFRRRNIDPRVVEAAEAILAIEAGRRAPADLDKDNLVTVHDTDDVPCDPDDDGEDEDDEALDAGGDGVDHNRKKRPMPAEKKKYRFDGDASKGEELGALHVAYARGERPGMTFEPPTTRWARVPTITLGAPAIRDPEGLMAVVGAVAGSAAILARGRR